jgi:Predicted enzyme related to lactoylglutathione lyase
MAKVTGIGGIFFKTKDVQKTKKWYQEHLGLQTDQWGTNFEWRTAKDPSQKGFTQWSPSSPGSNFFGNDDQQFMINYRVDDLEALIENLRNQGVKILDEIESVEYGKFVHILDPDGHKVQLWEPNDEEYDKIVEGRTF